LVAKPGAALSSVERVAPGFAIQHVPLRHVARCRVPELNLAHLTRTRMAGPPNTSACVAALLTADRPFSRISLRTHHSAFRTSPNSPELKFSRRQPIVLTGITGARNPDREEKRQNFLLPVYLWSRKEAGYHTDSSIVINKECWSHFFRKTHREVRLCVSITTSHRW